MKYLKCFITVAICVNILLISGTDINEAQSKNPLFIEDSNGSYELKALELMIINLKNNLKQKIRKIRNVLSAMPNPNNLDKRLQKSLELVETSNFTISKNQENVEKMIKAFYNAPLERLIHIGRDFQRKSELKTKHLQNLLSKTGLAADKILAYDCFDLYKLGHNASGTYWLEKIGLRVLCEMEANGGGWLVILRRMKVEKQVAPLNSLI